jgi:hypothetical protein
LAWVFLVSEIWFLEAILGTTVKSFKRNLRLPFTPLWSSFPVLQLISEPVKDHSTLNRSVIHEGDMERGSGKSPFFDGTNYPYWKIRMSTHIQGIDWLVWDIYEDTTYVVLEPHARTTQEQKDRHNANSRAHSVLFSSLSLLEFERVSDYTTAQEIWMRL